MYATITSKGQITLPKGLRADLDLEKGDRIEFILEDDGRYLIVPITSSLSSLKGLLSGVGKKALTIEEMEHAVKNRFNK